MNDLDPIAFGNTPRGPLLAPDDVFILLERNSFRRQRQFADQITERQSVRNLACFTVDLNARFLSPISDGRL